MCQLGYAFYFLILSVYEDLFLGDLNKEFRLNWSHALSYTTIIKRHLSDAAELINIGWLLSLSTSCWLLCSFE